MSAKLGRPFMPWQRHVSTIAGEVLPSGRMAYPVVVLIVPRRGGKTAMDLARKMQRAAADPGSRCWYTAQTGGDAGVTFRQDWVPAVQSAFSSSTAKVRLSNGSESITLPGRRSQVGLFAPTDTALHGQDSDDVTVDEAWAFSKEKGLTLEAAIRPTMATRKRRQLWIVSAGGTHESTWLLAWRELGRNLTGPDQGVAFFEWHPEVDEDGRPSVDLEDPAVWAATHPAIGHTISLDTLREDWQSMSRLDGGRELFYRSYLDIFTSTATGRLLPALAWDSRKDPRAAIDPALPVQLGYDVAEDRLHGAVTLSQLQSDGRVVTEVVSATGEPDNPGDPIRLGIGWMPARVKQLRDSFPQIQVAADSYGPAKTITRSLTELGFKVHVLDTQDMVEAAAELKDDVLVDGKLAHRGQKVLDDAAAAIGKRQLGDSWAWSRRMSASNPAPVLAMTISHWRARHFAAVAPGLYLGEAS
jgi:phage terminase large subunit-like protein